MHPCYRVTLVSYDSATDRTRAQAALVRTIGYYATAVEASDAATHALTTDLCRAYAHPVQQILTHVQITPLDVPDADAPTETPSLSYASIVANCTHVFEREPARDQHGWCAWLCRTCQSRQYRSPE